MSSPKTKTLQIRLTEDQYERAQAAADGGSVADVVRGALDRVLTEPCKRCSGTGLEPRGKRRKA